MFNIAAVAPPERSEGIAWQIRAPAKNVVIPLQYMLVGEKELSSKEAASLPVTDDKGLVYRSQKFPGYLSGINDDYTLTAQIMPEGEWSSESFEINIIRVGGAEIARKFSVVVNAENDGEKVTGRVSVVSPNATGDRVAVVFEELEFEVLWLRIVRRGEGLTVHYSTNAKAENFIELLSISVDDRNCSDWPMVVAGDTDGLCFDAATALLERP